MSLSPSLTEMLFAVGAGEQVVAVDKNSDFPEGVPTTDLSGFRPNVEAIAGYEPDLVVTSGDRDGVVAALEALDIQVLVFGSPDTLHQAQEQLLAIGEATGHFDEAEEVVERDRRRPRRPRRPRRRPRDAAAVLLRAERRSEHGHLRHLHR